jgi:D-3-phosphoglycerate dehydrogenase
MLGQLLSILADQNINIIDMLNKSRDDVAYNLIDVANAPNDAVLEQMRAVSGVVNVRLIR